MAEAERLVDAKFPEDHNDYGPRPWDVADITFGSNLNSVKNSLNEMTDLRREFLKNNLRKKKSYSAK